MAGVVRVRIDGLKELDAALGELSKGAARGVLRRTLIKAGEPMRAEAERLAPRDTGKLSRSVKIAARIDNRAGKREFGQVLKAGGTRAQATQALRDARRAQGVGASFAEAFMGPAKGSKRDAIKAIVQEFGSVKQDQQPYMRPAFDGKAHEVLGGIKSILTDEIAKAAARAKARALKKAAKV